MKLLPHLGSILQKLTNLKFEFFSEYRKYCSGITILYHSAKNICEGIYNFVSQCQNISEKG